MFVNIQKGNIVLKVPYKSFVKKYKPNGFEMVEEKEEMPDIETPETPVYEIPISEMNLQQLKAYAESKGIQTDNLKTAKALRDAIRGR